MTREGKKRNVIMAWKDHTERKSDLNLYDYPLFDTGSIGQVTISMVPTLLVI